MLGYDKRSNFPPAVVEIRRYDDGPDCDVVVTIGERQMVLPCPSYNAARRWAQIECKTYGISTLLDPARAGVRGIEAPSMRSTVEHETA